MPPYKRPSLSSFGKVETGESRRKGVLRFLSSFIIAKSTLLLELLELSNTLSPKLEAAAPKRILPLSFDQQSDFLRGLVIRSVDTG